MKSKLEATQCGIILERDKEKKKKKEEGKIKKDIPISLILLQD